MIKKATFVRPEEIGVNQMFDKMLAEFLNARFNCCVAALADWIGIRPEVVIEKAAEILAAAEIKQD